jgi:hypothetical protein
MDGRTRTQKAVCESWVGRIFELQLSVIYFFSGLTKFLDPAWMSGGALESVLRNPSYSRWDLNSLLQIQITSITFVFLTYFVMAWEVAFPFLVSIRRTRKVTLLIGVCFHVALLILLQLRAFSVLMLTLYLVFLRTERPPERRSCLPLDLGTAGPENEFEI